jgi:Domain of unknown function (DUF1707)/Cell wall-active antibiotics response 4TMS YvqF
VSPGGDPLPQPVPPAARDKVVVALTRHFADDHLTEAELETRLQRVFAATSSRDLDTVLADLPELPDDETPPAPATQPSTSEITALFSGHESKLVNVVPRALKLRARLGYIELDLSGAAFEPGLTTIDVQALLGYVEIRLPAGVRVENQGRALFGFFSLKGAGAPGSEVAPDSEKVVRITGRAVLGYAEGRTA